MDILHPQGWPRPVGFSYGLAARGRIVAVAGMTAPGADFVVQARESLAKILDVVAEAGGQPEHVVRLTWYALSRDEYMAARPRLGAAYRDLFGRHFPAMTLVEVSALVDDWARVEIEALAVVPD
jgi:enamine deaminase RidA (YjgF/YER057c/UK114 family)